MVQRRGSVEQDPGPSAHRHSAKSRYDSGGPEKSLIVSMGSRIANHSFQLSLARPLFILQRPLDLACAKLICWVPEASILKLRAAMT